MEIQIPEHIDLSLSGQYILIIEVRAKQFSFFLYHPEETNSCFYYRIPEDKTAGALAGFQNAFFDNALFTLNFKKIWLVNYTPVFACVPAWLQSDTDKDREEYLKFLFPVTGKVLAYTVQQPDMTLFHEIPEDVYQFLQRSFADAQMIPYMAALIPYFQDKRLFSEAKRMFVLERDKGVDILCFSGEGLLLCNHFDYGRPEDAVYYILYVWRQLQFDQWYDVLYMAGNTDLMQAQLKNYIRRMEPAGIPREILASSLCKL